MKLASQIQAGIYQALVRSKIPNRESLDPVLMEKLSAFDPGNRYTVPYMWGTSGIGYNPEKVKAALGDNATIDSWSLILDPDNAKKLSSCGIAILDERTEVLATILVYLGKDPNSDKPEDWKLAGEHLAKLVPYVQYFSSSRFVDGLASAKSAWPWGTQEVCSRPPHPGSRMVSISSTSFRRKVPLSGMICWPCQKTQ